MKISNPNSLKQLSAPAPELETETKQYYHWLPETVLPKLSVSLGQHLLYTRQQGLDTHVLGLFPYWSPVHAKLLSEVSPESLNVPFVTFIFTWEQNQYINLDLDKILILIKNTAPGFSL